MNKYVTLFSVIVISSLIVIGTVSAATTISTDIRTDGTASIGSSTPASNTLFSVGTSSPLFYIDQLTGYIGLGKTTPRAPLDFYNENDPTGTGWGGSDGTGLLFTGGVVQMDGVEDLSAGANISLSAGSTGSGGMLMRGEANRWNAAPTGATATIDIGRTMYIRAITWGSYFKDSLSSQFNAYTIEYSSDGTSYTTAVSVTNNSKTVVLHYFQPTINARYIRITNTGATNGYISNLQILGYSQQSQYSDQTWGYVAGNWGSGPYPSGNNIVSRTWGGVGMGTSTILSRLVVDEDKSRNNSNVVARFQVSSAGANSTAPTVYFGANDSAQIMRPIAGTGGVITDITTGAYQGALAFYTANNATPTEVGRFGATGNFGVGTTTAATKLQVTSGASATTTVTIGSLGLTSSKGCVNMNRADGGAGSFYISAAGTLVAEANYCR